MRKGKMFQRFLALLLAVLMVVSSNSLVYAMEDHANGEVVVKNEELETVSQEEMKSEPVTATEPEVPTLFASGSLNTGANGTLTRGEWLENLTILFDMTIESEDLPDNYFSDLTEESEYYETAMLAVEFGVIDIEAGEALNLDDPCTRDFAAKTLNYCLGFQLEEGTNYTFSDADACSNADSVQVAVNRGWFSLSGGKFLPEKTVTAAEIVPFAMSASIVVKGYDWFSIVVIPYLSVTPFNETE